MPTSQAVATALLSYPSTHPIQVGWCSRNSGAVASRTVNASLYNISVQLSSIISSFIYRADDAPRYHRGNKVLLIICILNLVVFYPFTKIYYIWRNKQRDRIWNAMSPEEQLHWLLWQSSISTTSGDHSAAFEIQLLRECRHLSCFARTFLSSDRKKIADPSG